MARASQPFRETRASDYFNRDPWDARTYPAPRAKRAGPPAQAAAQAVPGALAVPQTRSFTFSLRATPASRRTSVSSPRLRGPAVIINWFASKGGSASGVMGVGLGKAASPVREQSVAETIPLPFTPFAEGLEAIDAASGITPDNTTGLLDMQPSLLMNNTRAGILVMDPEWFLVVYTAANGTPNDVVGYVTLIEGVTVDMLPFLL